MTFEDFALARKTLYEEKIGAPVREAKRIENAQARAARKHIARKDMGA